MQETKETQVQALGWEDPLGGHDNPLQYSCLESPTDRGAWRATVHGTTKSQTRLKQHARVEQEKTCNGEYGHSFLSK